MQSSSAISSDPKNLASSPISHHQTIDISIIDEPKTINKPSSSSKTKAELAIKDNWQPIRYGEIIDQFPREIVMLRGRGCFHSKCTFCDYHLDKSDDLDANFILNKEALDQVKGHHGELEIICSGSIQELDQNTLDYIKKVSLDNGIQRLSLECHYIYRRSFEHYRQFFAPIEAKFRVGIESFDATWREVYMNKKMGYPSPETIAEHFEYCNLLVGEATQTKKQILNDIAIAGELFERICVGVITENEAGAKRNEALISWFVDEIVPTIKNNPKFQILISDDDFPLGDGCMTV